MSNQDDWKDHWIGMPEFIQDDKTPYKSIKINFQTEQDYLLFQETIKQKLTSKTKSIWFPYIEKTDHSKLKYIDKKDDI